MTRAVCQFSITPTNYPRHKKRGSHRRRLQRFPRATSIRARQRTANGDFNDDGTVNFSDLLTLAQNYCQSTPSALASVPEPASIPILVSLAALICKRR